MDLKKSKVGLADEGAIIFSLFISKPQITLGLSTKRNAQIQYKINNLRLGG